MPTSTKKVIKTLAKPQKVAVQSQDAKSQKDSTVKTNELTGRPGPIELTPKEAKALVANRNRKCLGRGGFGFVYAMKFRTQMCAVKIGFKKVDEFGDSGEDVLRHEIKMTLKTQKCENSIHAVAYHLGNKKEGSPPILVLEWAGKGDLIHKKMPWGVALAKLKQLFLGLDQLHQTGLIHFDIKPDNLLIDSNDQVRIADFGFAMSKRNARTLVRQDTSGSPGYEAPESTMAKMRGKKTLGKEAMKVDVFAGGMTSAVILAEAYIRSYPGDTNDLEIMGDCVGKCVDDEAVLNLREDLRVAYPLLRKFFTRVCARDATKRANAMEAAELVQAMIDDIPQRNEKK